MLLALVLLTAWPAAAQVAMVGAPCKITDGSCAGAQGSSYNSTTGTTTLTGSLVARNVVVAELATPVIASVTPGGTAGVTTYGYKAVAYLASGASTAASAEVTTATGNATLSATNFNTVVWGAVTGAAEYRLYRTTGGAAPPKLIYTGTATSYQDTGSAGTAETPSPVNTTGVVTASRVLTGDGAGANPGLGFGTGIGIGSSSGLRFSHGGAYVMGFTSSGIGLTASYEFGFAPSTNVGVRDTILTRAAAATLQLGAANAASPVAQTLKVQDATGSNANGAASFTISAPAGRGTGTRGSILFTAPQVAASGDNAQTQATRLAIKELTINLPSLPVYADNTAALAGSLVAGDVYRTSTGVLMVTY